MYKSKMEIYFSGKKIIHNMSTLSKRSLGFLKKS